MAPLLEKVQTTFKRFLRISPLNLNILKLERIVPPVNSDELSKTVRKCSSKNMALNEEHAFPTFFGERKDKPFRNKISTPHVPSPAEERFDGVCLLWDNHPLPENHAPWRWENEVVFSCTNHIPIWRIHGCQH